MKFRPMRFALFILAALVAGYFINQAIERARIEEVIRNSVPTALYDKDDRYNFYEVGPNEQAAASATAVMVPLESINARSENVFDLKADPTQYCKNERFRDEPKAGLCTGFRVGENILATAGHCVPSGKACRENAWVFGFSRNSEDDLEPQKGFAKEQILLCDRIIDRGAGGEEDWALIKLHRKPPDNAPIVRLAREISLHDGDAVNLTTIGYPDGLPLKLSLSADLEEVRDKSFILTSDTFGGNSGAPVFRRTNIETGEFLVEGVFIGGQKDFEWITPIAEDGADAPAVEQCKIHKWYCTSEQDCENQRKMCVWIEQETGDKCGDFELAPGETAMHASFLAKALDDYNKQFE